MPTSDIKTPWGNYPVPMPGLGGDSVVSSGSDPNVDTSGSSSLKTNYDKAVVSAPSGSESDNSVSGLPAQPNRFEPSGTPPAPPSLEDRNPGTIDER